MRKSVDLPIVGYVGANGHGKTLAMVHDLALPAMVRGLPVMANFGLDYERFVPLRSWRQLVQPVGVGPHPARLLAFGGEEGVVLLDEISAVLPARQAMSVPAQLVRVLNQLRKAGVTVGWTAPAWARCDTVLREVTQGVAVCQGFWVDRWAREPGVYAFPRRGPARKDEAGQRIRVSGWGSHCLFRVRYYDAKEFDEFSYGRIEGVRPMASRWHWRPGHRAHLVYGTMDGVDLLDHLDESGACINCGGNRPRRKCECALESPFGVGGGASSAPLPGVAAPLVLAGRVGGAVPAPGRHFARQSASVAGGSADGAAVRRGGRARRPGVPRRSAQGS